MAVNMAAGMASPDEMAWAIEEAVTSIRLFREGKLTVFNRALPPGSAAIFDVGIVQALVNLEYATGVEAESCTSCTSARAAVRTGRCTGLIEIV